MEAMPAELSQETGLETGIRNVTSGQERDLRKIGNLKKRGSPSHL